MTRDELMGIIEGAASDLRDNDAYLLEVNVSERCIAHKFAEYINIRLKLHPDYNTVGYAVDCEYNRDGIDPKTIPRRFRSKDDDGKTYPYPDVVIHRRGAAGPNLLAVEIKLTSNVNIGDDVAYTKWKLDEYREHLKYQFSLYICFITGDVVGQMLDINPAAPCYDALELIG